MTTFSQGPVLQPDTAQPETTDTKFYLVGRVPVKMREGPDGVTLLAYNPLLGGFVSDARYYSTIKRHEGDEDGVERISQAQFETRVSELGGSLTLLAQFRP